MKRVRKQNGYAILIVLIAVAILLLLAATQMKTLFVPKGAPLKTGLEQRPWLLEALLAGDGDAIKLPQPPKPPLVEPLTIQTGVRRDDTERGTVSIDFDTDGRVRAAWETSYLQNEQTYAIAAAMAGNIHVKQTWEGPDGNDKSRLFFIARGDYVKTTAGGPDERGSAWLTGWLKPDRSAEGHITLTTDRKWSAVYDWSAAAAAENQ